MSIILAFAGLSEDANAQHFNDLANFWDWYDQPHMPLGPATDAFRLGVNYMVYALTH